MFLRHYIQLLGKSYVHYPLQFPRMPLTILAARTPDLTASTQKCASIKASKLAYYLL